MAQDIFIKINGIDGESQDAAHKNEIEVRSWGWQILQQSNMHMGSGGGAGKATVEDLAFEHLVDRASPNLMKYCLTGKHIDQAVLTIRKAGGNPLEYLKITMPALSPTMTKGGLASWTKKVGDRISPGDRYLATVVVTF